MRALAGLLALLSSTASAAASRSVEVVETVVVPFTSTGTALRLWVPKPPSDAQQVVELLGVSAPWPHRLTRESEFGNETVYMEGRSAAAGTVRVSLRYRVTRRLQDAPATGPATRRDLRPRALEKVNGEIHALAAKATTGLSDPLLKGRALYDLVLARMSYDKSGDGWGRGDSLYACRIGKGNCTDFHSLFMALAHSAGLPARFRMGYSLPKAPAGELLSGYHCWAEFYAGPRGWVPVDISAAWKDRSRADFYFGNLDADRVLVSTGRDLRLSPAQAGHPLNFLNRPYAELDGQPNTGLEFTRSYKDLPG